jgi:hypothetical protein
MLGEATLGTHVSAVTIPSVKIVNRVVTPTQIIFTTVAGPMQVNVTFMNPVEVCF